MSARDPRLGALDVWLSRGLDAQPSPRREAPTVNIGLPPRRDAAPVTYEATWLHFAEAIEERDRATAAALYLHRTPGRHHTVAEATEARHRVAVADLCDAFGLSAEERASVTAYRGPGNPDALAFLVGGEVAAMVAGEPDKTGNHPVTIAPKWRHRLRGGA